MKTVFFGTPQYVIPVLDTLHKVFKSRSGESPIAAVVTQPPKPTGRKQRLEYSPVDGWAHNKKVAKFFDPSDIIKNNTKADLGVLASYGAIIPEKVINHFPYGILNIHPSLLPRWRGSSPVQATLISGEEVGVTIIKIDDKLDHGPIISQFKDQVLSEDTTETLRSKLFERSAEVLATLIPAYLKGKITLREQDHSKATYTREIRKEDAFLPPKFLGAVLQGVSLQELWQIQLMRDFSVEPTPEVVERFIRAMQPWPGAWTFVSLPVNQEKKRLKILNSHIENSQLVLDEVQLEGKNPVTWKQFRQGYPDFKFEAN